MGLGKKIEGRDWKDGIGGQLPDQTEGGQEGSEIK